MPLFSGQALGGQWRKWILGAVKDLFNRSNTTTGLGSSDTGQPWQAIRGNWFINNNQAQSTDTPSNYPIAAVQSGLMTPYIKADVDTAGGTGIAFWVSDTQNWYGLYPYTATNTSYSQTCATYSQTGPGYVCSGGYSQTGPSYYCNSWVQTGPFYSCSSVSGPGYGSACNSSYGPVYGSGCNSWSVKYDGFRGYWYSTCSGGYYAVGPSYGCLSYTTTGPFYSCLSASSSYGSACNSSIGPNYGSSCNSSSGPFYGSSCASYSSTPSYSAGQVYLRLIKSVANTISTVLDQAISSLPASLQVFFSGNQITAKAYASAGQQTQIGTDLVTTEASPTKATVHGLVLAPGGYTQGTTADNISISTVQ